MKPVFNTLGEDISLQVMAAAVQARVDEYELLALLYAESGLNPYAERWGTWTTAAKENIEQGDRDNLLYVINQVWPDISFGYSQRIVLFHTLGDRNPTVENCLQVRSEVFADPVADMQAAAHRYWAYLRHETCDGTALSAMIVYNAGSDRRSDPDWNRMWSGNVANYQAALNWAEQYRDDESSPPEVVDMPEQTPHPTVIAGLDFIWNRLTLIQELTGQWSSAAEAAEQAKQDGIVQVKRALGIQE